VGGQNNSDISIVCVTTTLAYVLGQKRCKISIFKLRVAFFLGLIWWAAAVATSLPLSLGIDNVLNGQDVQTDGFVTAASMVGVPATAERSA
jgi:hypothetical protein